MPLNGLLAGTTPRFLYKLYQIEFLETICIYVYIYQWRAVTFQPGDAVQKIELHFFKFYFILRSFCKMYRYPCNTIFHTI